MKIQANQKLYIPAVTFLMAVMMFALSPMAPALAQESTDAAEPSDRPMNEKSYEAKDGKSCDKKHKDSSKSVEASGNQA